MKTLAEVETRRKLLERELEDLDMTEQAWAEISREARIAELIHGVGCSNSHGDYQGYCKFHLGTWDTPNNAQRHWLGRAKELVAVLPEDMSDDEVFKVYRVARG